MGGMLLDPSVSINIFKWSYGPLYSWFLVAWDLVGRHPLGQNPIVPVVEVRVEG